MPYSEILEARIVQELARWPLAISRRKMFGGTCHLLNGNMLCGVYQDFLILRLGPAGAAQALSGKQAKRFDITGKPMTGWVMINETEVSDTDLQRWLEQARAFVATLPAKSPK